MELVDVRPIEVSRSLLQRLLGLGTVAVASAASAEFLIIMFEIPSMSPTRCGRPASSALPDWRAGCLF
jgi:hypothetical protein